MKTGRGEKGEKGARGAAGRWFSAVQCACGVQCVCVCVWGGLYVLLVNKKGVIFAKNVFKW